MRTLGQVVKRGKVWHIRFRYRGIHHRESSGSTRRSDAVALLQKRLSEAISGRIVGAHADRVTFADLMKLVESDYRTNGRKSLGSLLDRVAVLNQSFGKRRAIDITHSDLTAFVNKRLAEGAKPATVRYELVVVGRAYKLAVRGGLLTSAPLLPTIHVSNARQGFFEPEELARVLAHLPPHLAALVEFLSLTGWRKSEATGLTFAQIDFNAGVIRLEPGTTKSGEGRAFPFLSLPSLGRLLVRQGEHVAAMRRELSAVIPFVFPRPDGRRIGQFHKEWTRACKAAGVVRMVHDLRRSAVRSMLRAGINEKVAMMLAGFKTRAILDRYHVVSEADLTAAVEKLARHSS
jgi:integrase